MQPDDTLPQDLTRPDGNSLTAQHITGVAAVDYQANLTRYATVVANLEAWQQYAMALEKKVEAQAAKITKLTPKENSVNQVIDILEGRPPGAYTLKSAEDLVGSRNGSG